MIVAARLFFVCIGKYARVCACKIAVSLSVSFGFLYITISLKRSAQQGYYMCVKDTAIVVHYFIFYMRTYIRMYIYDAVNTAFQYFIPYMDFSPPPRYRRPINLISYILLCACVQEIVSGRLDTRLQLAIDVYIFFSLCVLYTYLILLRIFFLYTYIQLLYYG